MNGQDGTSALVDPDVARAGWQDPERFHGVVEFTPEVLARLPLPPDQRQYLQQAGLPRSAGPFLGFDVGTPEVLQDMIWYPTRRPVTPTDAMSCWAMTGLAT